MKEGAFLFCPKCGNPVSKDDNFCAYCGKNLKDVRVNVTSDNNKDTNKIKKISENTRVFNPKSLDSIDTTDELKNIIEEVDRKISKNIEDHEKGNVQKKSPERENKKDKFISNNLEKNKESKFSKENRKNSPEKLSSSSKISDKDFLIDDNSKNIKDNFNISQKELVKRVQEELKKSNYKENSSKSTFSSANRDSNSNNYELSQKEQYDSFTEDEKSRKFSFKEKWQNFINEDDDEYSIFSNLKDDDSKKEDTRNLEISKSLEDSDKNFENTLSTPKVDIEEAIVKSDKEKKDNLNKKNSDNKSLKDDSDKKFNSPNKNILSKKIFKEKKSQNPKNTEEKINKSEKLKDLFTFKDKGEKPVKEIEKSDSKFDKSIEKKFSKRENQKNSKFSKTLLEWLDKILENLDILTSRISNYIGDLGSRESKIVIGIGASLTAISVLIGNGSFSFLLILFIILKLVFDYLEFYIPLNIATDRDDIDTSYSEVKKFALINWIICKVFLFIGFIISPYGGFLKYDILQALTAMPLATLLVIILSLLIAITLYNRDLGESKINFIGWYAIPFTLLELLFKMVWFIINFIFVTLF
ncbi:MAG: zinc ribbon domain-containing protein [Peptoniphilus rhinitidis]|uniref:zinc ribbon domain-containing protein n=1 Tax=Peptoniphilus rhinitidis TaxID=1175452 RepID=UPI0029118A76|nr:zinc ribbon domain-containing protein [Peptoniphilus rhinitidis]MDU3750858.1 zinc ribbon domain-containing protein [Peptoniphilus rhinitidis]